LKNEVCVPVCTKSYRKSAVEDARNLRFLKRSVILNYQHHWIIDNLPVVWCYTTESKKIHCSRGFPVGCYVTKAGLRKDACRIFVSKI
jgi:transmembrane 9 superfamily protein 2/4